MVGNLQVLDTAATKHTRSGPCSAAAVASASKGTGAGSGTI